MSPSKGNIIFSTNSSINEATDTETYSEEQPTQLNIKLTDISKRLNKITLYEKPDIEALNKLINSDLLLPSFSCKLTTKIYNNEKQQLIAYKKLINNNGLVPVTYNKTNGFKYGRVFPSRSLGAVGIRREVRGTLFNKNMVDIDIENCHPVLSSQLCEANGINNKYLENYVLNRPELLEHIQDLYNVSRDKAKNLFIILLYFGSFKTWANKNEVNIEDKEQDKFIIKFKKELSLIGDFIIKDNNELKKEVEKLKKKQDKNTTEFKIRSSTVSIYFQEIENSILEEIYFYCIENKYISECCSLCYDGLMIEKTNYKPELLNELNVLIKNKFGFNLKFTEKKMTHYLDELDEHIIESVDEYDTIKKEFELNNFKILDPISFATIKKDGGLIIRSKKEFYDVYENLSYKGINKAKEEEEKPFIKQWLQDKNNRTYNNIDFLPMQQAPLNVYNTFRGYEAEKKELFNVDIMNSKIMMHIKHLCDNDDNATDYFIKTLARKLQQPYNLTNTALIFKSKEGAGKDLFFNWLGNKIIGSEYYFNTDKPELLFGKFNSVIENKILVIMNETSGKDTYSINENIKCAITAEINTIEHKGQKPYKNANNIQYIFLTNNDNPVKVPHGDRRFCGIECDNTICNNKEYFDALIAEMNREQYDKAFYNYLMSIDVNNYDFTNNRPITKFYNDMKEMNKPTLIIFLETIIEKNYKQQFYKVVSSSLFLDFNDFLNKFNFKIPITITKFIRDIKKIDGVDSIRSPTTRYINFDIEKLKQHLIKEYNIEFNYNDISFIDDDENEEVEKDPLDM